MPHARVVSVDTRAALADARREGDSDGRRSAGPACAERALTNEPL